MLAACLGYLIKLGPEQRLPSPPSLLTLTAVWAGDPPQTGQSAHGAGWDEVLDLRSRPGQHIITNFLLVPCQVSESRTVNSVLN